jgi:hypothetical protein
MHSFTQIKRLGILQNLAIIVLSSALTFASLVLLVRSGHLQILTTFTERVHHEFCSTTAVQCHCAEPEKCIAPSPSRELYPKVFDSIHALRPAYGTVEAAKKVDWEAVLLPPNGGFLMVEEFDHKIKGYGVSMFHSLHCLTYAPQKQLLESPANELQDDVNTPYRVIEICGANIFPDAIC